MKQILLTGAVLLALSSCKSTFSVTQNWINTHCETKTLGAYTVIRCNNLYETDKVKAICPEAKVTYDVANSYVEVKTRCLDSASITDLIKPVFFNKK